MSEVVTPGPFGRAAEVDPLLACLHYLAWWWDRPTSVAALAAGLPMGEDGRLEAETFEAAAERIGLRPKADRRSVAELARSGVAVVVELDGAGPVVVTDVDEDAGTAMVFRPGAPAATTEPLAGLVRAEGGRAWTVAADPARSRAADFAGRAEGLKRHWFWGEVAKHMGDLRYVLGAAVVINLLAFAMPLFTMNVYDRIIPNEAAASLWVLAVGVLLALGFDLLLRLARAYLVDDVGRRIDLKLSSRIFEKVLNTPLTHRASSTGAYVKRITDYESVRDFFTSTTALLLVDVAFMGLFLAVILVLGGPLVLIPIAGVAVIVAAGFVLQKAMAQALRDAQTEAALHHSVLVEAVNGLETIKSLGAEGRMLSRWRRHATDSSATQERLRKLTALSVNVASATQQAIGLFLILGGFYWFTAGNMSMGAIIAVVLISGRALAPVGQFAFLMTRARQAMLSLESLQKIMDAPDERETGAGSMDRAVRSAEVEFRDLRFRYPDAPSDALAGVSLRIAPGERVGIIGRVASGKSTLGRVLCGLYAPTEGALLVQGADSRQFPVAELRRAFRFVGQEADLFGGTIRDNLRLGSGAADDERLLDSMRLVGADQLVARDPSGFDRVIGERGARLSGGQRQFLAVSRAVTEGFELLFLDEPSGAMDIQSERLFVERLKAGLGPDQTLVVATHRHAVLDLVDRVIVMDQGRIVADGPKAQVLAGAAAPAAVAPATAKRRPVASAG